mgnify:CR=1 FL=1
MAKKTFIALSFFGAVLVAGLIISLTYKPNKIEITGAAVSQDSLAQCLSDKGIIFYGSFECSHCTNQKKLFGGSMKYVNYVECGPLGGPINQACRDAGIQVYPTWLINGQKYTGTQSLDKLKELSGC